MSRAYHSNIGSFLAHVHAVDLLDLDVWRLSLLNKLEELMLRVEHCTTSSFACPIAVLKLAPNRIDATGPFDRAFLSLSACYALTTASLTHNELDFFSSRIRLNALRSRRLHW